MSDPQDYRVFATGLADMARTLLAQETVQDTLDQIVAHAVKLVVGCDTAGVMVVRRGVVTTLATSGDVAGSSDRCQGELGEGPCFDATIDRAPVFRIEDLHVPDARWPRYVEQARALGIGSMMGFLLYTAGDDNLGALNLYSARRNAFTKQTEQVGWILASHAAVALATARHEEHMAHALATSRVIGEAIGVVMSRYRLTEQDAFDRIRRASQHGNVKIRDLAEIITTTGDIPSRGDLTT